ncbi:hypothetical protein ABL841_28665 [Variovorax paradoxus]|nr:hypothetical protein [Variovorax paradoxus]
MHQDPAHRVPFPPAGIILSADGLTRETDQFGFVSLVRDRRRVLEDEQRARIGMDTITCREEVALEDRFLIDFIIGEEAMRSLRVGPVLARRRYRASNAAAKLIKQAAQSLAQSCVAKLATGDLAGYP